MDGKSLVPLINGNNESRIAFSQSGNPLDSGKPPKEPNVYSVRTDEWKYIRNIHDSTEELYDLLNDPHENSNLFSQKTEKSVDLASQDATRLAGAIDSVRFLCRLSYVKASESQSGVWRETFSHYAVSRGRFARQSTEIEMTQRNDPEK